MIAIWILCGILLLLLAALFIPVSIRTAFRDGNLELSIRWGPIQKELLNGEKKEKQQTAPEEKRKEKKKGNTDKKKSGINRRQILFLIENVPPILKRVCVRLGKKLRIRPLKLYILVAGQDPADTATLYGKLQAAFAAVLPELHRHISIEDQDIRLYVDFIEERMDLVADVGIMIRPASLLSIGISAGVSCLRLLRGYQQLADSTDGDGRDCNTKKYSQQQKATASAEATAGRTA